MHAQSATYEVVDVNDKQFALTVNRLPLRHSFHPFAHPRRIPKLRGAANLCRRLTPVARLSSFHARDQLLASWIVEARPRNILQFFSTNRQPATSDVERDD